MKKFLLVSMMLIVGISLVFAGGKGQQSKSSSGAVVLKYAHYSVGTHLSRPWWDSVYKRFTEKYKGQIELNIEELPSDAAYIEKMKVLAASRELPDVIDGVNRVRDLAIQNGQAVELSPYLAGDVDFRDKAIGPVALAANTMPDGKIYSVTSIAEVVGYFYNKDHFRKAGISPAKTWDEFMSNNDKLLASGVTPLALMTGENSWCTNLILTAMVASKGKTGETFSNTKEPRTYQIPEVIQSLTDIQKCLQKYTTPDALGAQYANAANNFLMEKTAIIANGPWMIEDFSNPEKTAAGFDQKVDFAMYPGDGLVTSYAEGFSICAPAERRDAAWKFLVAMNDRDSQLDRLRLMGTLPSSPDLKLTAEMRREMPLVAKHVDALGAMKYHADTFDVTALAAVVDAFGRYYPDLAAGRLTPAAMAARLDQAAAGAR